MKIAVVSMRFAPGHIAHLRAYKELFSHLGCDVKLFLADGYRTFFRKDEVITYTEDINTILLWKPDYVLSYNISTKNIGLAKKCRDENIRFFYVLHEPWAGIKELIGEKERLPRRIVANMVNYLTCRRAHKVILASENGKRKYEKYMGNCNENYDVFPLIFCDDFDLNEQYTRECFSYIGGFTDSRGSNAFLGFVKYAISNNLPIHFSIATRSNVVINDDLLEKGIADGTLEIKAGVPLTTEEINSYYRKSICVWNAYKNSTQSGVLVNALMQGAPVIVTDRGDTSNVVEDKKEGCFIHIPYDNEEIHKAYIYIADNITEMERKARNRFLNNYLYSIYFNDAKKVYEIYSK